MSIIRLFVVRIIVAEVILNVKALKTIDFTTELGTAGLSADKKRIGLGDLAVGKIGITFNGKVETPAGMSKGTWQFVQTTQMSRFFTSNLGKKYEWSINNQIVFDTDDTLAYPYAGPFAADGKPQSADDSPSSGDLPAINAYSVKKELYKMYIIHLGNYDAHYKQPNNRHKSRYRRTLLCDKLSCRGECLNRIKRMRSGSPLWWLQIAAQ